MHSTRASSSPNISYSSALAYLAKVAPVLNNLELRSLLLMAFLFDLSGSDVLQDMGLVNRARH